MGPNSLMVVYVDPLGFKEGEESVTLDLNEEKLIKGVAKA